MEGETTKQELFPGAEAEFARRMRRESAKGQGKLNPLPGALTSAFADVPEVVGGLQVRPLVHYDFVILKRLSSPFLPAFLGQEEVQYTEEQGYEFVWQFTRPVMEVKHVVELGRQAVTNEAVKEIGMKVGPRDLTLLMKAVIREFIRAFCTAVEYQQTPTEGNGTVFSAPPASQTTGSVGG